MTGSPDQLKDRLIEKYFFVNAVDQAALKRELSGLGASYMETGRGLKVTYVEKTPQLLISSLTVPLIKLDIHQPTLEEAYLDLIKEERVL